jgi:hypothetical protein
LITCDSILRVSTNPNDDPEPIKMKLPEERTWVEAFDSDSDHPED